MPRMIASGTVVTADTSTSASATRRAHFRTSPRICEQRTKASISRREFEDALRTASRNHIDQTIKDVLNKVHELILNRSEKAQRLENERKALKSSLERSDRLNPDTSDRVLVILSRDRAIAQNVKLAELSLDILGGTLQRKKMQRLPGSSLSGPSATDAIPKPRNVDCFLDELDTAALVVATTSPRARYLATSSGTSKFAHNTITSIACNIHPPHRARGTRDQQPHSWPLPPRGYRFRQQHARSTLAIIVNENKTTKICAFCFDRVRMARARKRVGHKIKVVTTNGSVECTNKDCPTRLSHHTIRNRDGNAATSINDSGVSALLAPDRKPLQVYRQKRPRILTKKPSAEGVLFLPAPSISGSVAGPPAKGPIR
ncbi:hypothetical protein KVV02_006893 [Mortierella alpina]|uniref:Uncharacterized protein n=1 Tax=Mortierella alpina TaxID=64518 RepID=A0A9P8CYJ9_MORAP|nr:hypothetical protein KVV02_006893 [Mortierella alpina]